MVWTHNDKRGEQYLQISDRMENCRKRPHKRSKRWLINVIEVNLYEEI